MSDQAHQDSTSTVTHANWAAVDTIEFHTQFDEEIAKRRQETTTVWNMIIDGKRQVGGDRRRHVSPGDSRVELGHVATANHGDVESAIAAAHEAFPEWRKTPFQQRIEMFRRVADEIHSHRFEVAALISIEIGKNRYEAMTEVQEAIELLRFYCRMMEEQDGLITLFPSLGDERSASVMRPYGVWAILGPFNFPFALVAGMTCAALITGNTAVIKPPDLAPAAGVRFVELCLEAGLPSGILHVVMGDAEVGRMLTQHRLVDGVGFTGSMHVGQSIARALVDKPVVAEMGGKNPAIVMRSADLEVAAEAICRSAFRYAGQKCSACSRVFVHEDLTDELADEIFSRAQNLTVGIPWHAETIVGPLIDQASKIRFDEALVMARRAGRRTLVTTIPDGLSDYGAYSEFAIVVDLPEGHELLSRELFSPLLCIQSVKSLDEAIVSSNHGPYGLSAGIYSRDPIEIDRFLDEIEAGVVYVNRPTGATTGAWVGHQSFGGWKGSGSTGVNAHGPYYLQQFTREQSRTVTGGP